MKYTLRTVCFFMIKWALKSNQKTKNFQSDSADKYYF